MTVGLFAAIVMVIVGAIMVGLALWYGQDAKQAWQAWDMVYPAYWEPGDCEGNLHISIVIPPNHSKPDISISYEDDIYREWRELDG